MKAMSHLSYLSSASVVAAVLICMVGVAVADNDVTLRIFNSGIAMYEGFGAVTNIVFAYGMCISLPSHATSIQIL
jgi:hypothetical protein